LRMREGREHQQQGWDVGIEAYIRFNPVSGNRKWDHPGVSGGMAPGVVGAPCFPLLESCLHQTGNTNNGGEGMISEISKGKNPRCCWCSLHSFNRKLSSSDGKHQQRRRGYDFENKSGKNPLCCWCSLFSFIRKLSLPDGKHQQRRRWYDFENKSGKSPRIIFRLILDIET